MLFAEGNNRKVFRVPLEEHLNATDRTISYVIELCICCLLEKGLFEEGLLRVGCGKCLITRCASRFNRIHTHWPVYKWLVWKWFWIDRFRVGKCVNSTNPVHWSNSFLPAGSKLRRLRSAIDANVITTPYPNEYLDANVIASALKSYLRDLPEPLLTFNLYDQFIAASQRPTEEQRKTAILNTINQLPPSNYENLRYLTKFLGKPTFQIRFRFTKNG